MGWEVEFTDEFGDWWDELTEDQQDAITARVQLLEEHGPGLGRPLVDTIAGSRHANVKELRASKDGALRILFVFDPRRNAVLLVAGDKSGQWKQWYEVNIPVADDLYDEHLRELEKEGLI